MTTLPSIQGEEVAQQSSRVLTAWLSEQEATLQLLGREPMPQEDLTQISQKITTSKAALAARPVLVPKNPVVDTGDDSALHTLKERPDIRAAFAGHSWYPAMVDLREILAFQKIISIEGLETRVDSARIDKESLLELCLPVDQPLPPSAAMVDPDRKGFTLSSLNPNLRIIAGQVGQAEVNTGPGLPSLHMQALMFLVLMGSRYLQVVHYKGRYFIRDGYHRAAGLLREHIDIVPCVLIDARNFEDVVSQPQMFLPYEVLFGERPPRLTDFWDDDVSHTVSRPAVHKVVRG